jgi:hypothetical protein
VSFRTRLGIDIDADASGVDRGVGQATGRLGRLGGVVSTVAKGAAVGLGAIGAAAGYIASESVESASRTQQAMGAVETVFGRASAKVKRWAEDSADSVGLAEAEYAELATVVGSQLQNMGLSQDKATAKTKDLIKIGADMAATYGGTVSDAVSAVSSLLRGEADPIERYGVGIKKADINARVAAMGLGELEGAQLKQAETQAALSLLNEQTAKTQGAFARESDTLAGAQARLSAKVENLKSGIGEALLPVMTNLTNLAGDRLLPGLVRLGDAAQKRLGPALSEVGTFIRERVVPAGRELFEWYAEKIGPQLANLGRIVIPAVASAFERVADKVKANRPELEKLRDAFVKIIEFIIEKVYPIVATTLAGAFEVVGTAIGVVIDLVAGLVRGFEKVVEWGGKVKDALANIKIPDIDLPGNPFNGRGRGGGFNGFSLQPPTVPTPPPVDARTFISISVDGSGIVDENAVAQAIVTAINNLYTRLGLPAPLPTAG